MMVARGSRRQAGAGRDDKGSPPPERKMHAGAQARRRGKSEMIFGVNAAQIESQSNNAPNMTIWPTLPDTRVTAGGGGRCWEYQYRGKGWGCKGCFERTERAGVVGLAWLWKGGKWRHVS